MGAMDHQLGFFDEVTWATAGVVNRFFEFESADVEEIEGRTEGSPLRVGSGFVRSDRFAPYFKEGKGAVEFAVMSKGFGFFLKHMLGGVATTGPTDSVYTHTGTEGSLVGKGLTMQLNKPFHPSGTNQAFTYSGGKVMEWSLANAVDGNLILTLGLDFATQTTATALAAASYPAAMDNLTWAGGTLTVGGAAYDVTEMGLSSSNGLNTDRQQIRGNTQKKEQTASRREGAFSFKADFDSLTQRNRVRADVRATALASVVGRWVGPTLAGVSTYPELTVSVPVGRFDSWKAPISGPDAIEQELSGVVRYDGTSSPITVVYKSVDVTP